MDEQPVTTGDTDVPAPSTATTCGVDEQWVGRVAVVSVSGEIDMLTAPQLEKGIRAAVAQSPAGLVVDLTDVEFFASAGMGVLVAVHDEVSPGIRFCVVAEGPATSRPLKLVGISDLVTLYPTREEALSALGA